LFAFCFFAFYFYFIPYFFASRGVLLMLSKKLAMIFLSDLRKENNTSTFLLPGVQTTADEAKSEQFVEFKNEVLDGHLAKWYHILGVLVNFIQNRAPCSALY